MLGTAAALLLVGWLPGAVIFRLPIASRDVRAALAPEERTFWAVILSLTISVSLTMLLAAAGEYSFGRLLALDAGLTGLAAAGARFRLRYGGTAAGPTLLTAVPVLLAVLMGLRAFPPAEYVIGGKDPGIYMNAGIQIAQRGSLVTDDGVIASVPAGYRDLFFPSHDNPNYYSLRFMGFFIQDPQTGRVVAQFPHLFPASVAIGYGLDGLTGARRAAGVWAVLGVLAVYFVGVRLVGHVPAALACVLLSLHVLEVWYAKFPNSEIMMQALLLAALLAADRAVTAGDRFFGAAAGLLLGVQWTLRVDVALAIGAVAAVITLGILPRRRVPWSLVVPLVVLTALGFTYLATLMTGYSYYPLEFTRDWVLLPAAGAGLGYLALLAWAARTPERSEMTQRILPVVLVVVAIAAAAYGWLLRAPQGRTAAHDAFALRTFVALYLSPAGFIAALAGFAYVALTRFWRAPVFVLTATAFASFFFYKIRVVPEHFWMGRRFVPVILPAALLFICAIALSGLHARSRLRRVTATVLGGTFLLLLGARYADVTRPVLAHVEYRDVIPKIETMARQFGDNDLIVFESRDASDVHLLALPLAYIYARDVLVFANAVPDKAVFAGFLDWARTRYSRVFFVGSGGTDLSSREWTAAPRGHARFGAPEYEQTTWTVLPRGPRQKMFDYAAYEFGAAGGPLQQPFDLDVGEGDDLHVVRFHAKEQTEGRWMRWTRRTSFVTLPTFARNPRTLTLWMNDGGRPAAAPAGRVTLTLEGHRLGDVTVGSGFRPYTFDLPAGVLDANLRPEARLTIASSLWKPHEVLGTGDERELGVMVDRIRVE